ncbi:hypothetical protein QFC22_000415 [Naganishia vaughanmartiniae]|uniref:Uncharacterized protein n=1 Tax=Naganishia vaughanmartiniae TaxID=1424756 RepID=A0ACC2XN07_9TREE|nr:hypothetical protein QFC22_000415 [Naganishia vaughanmartiniae]
MELVNAGYPEFTNVTDLATFDAAAVSYLGNLDECEFRRELWQDLSDVSGNPPDRATKFGSDQLACTNATTAIIRYSRSILCSTWINAESSLKCFNLYTNTDITPCGYALPVLPSSTTSATATATTAGVVAAHNGLNGGQIAGIVVGSAIGGLLLLGLLIGLLICCGVLGGRGKRRRSAQSESPFTQESKLDPFQGAQREDPTYVANPTPATSASSAAASPNITSTPSGMPGALAAPILLPTEPAAAAAAAGGRNVLASMRDENQSGEHLILPNSVVTVLWPYTATLADELTLIPGMRLVVLRIYDDAWVTGQILDCVDDPTQNGKEGAFPLVCVTQADSSGTGSLAGLNKVESSELSPTATV